MQVRSSYKSWVCDQTKLAMRDRDLARTRAKASDSEEDWATFREQRNNCTKLLRKDKTSHQKIIFDKIESEKDSSKLFSMTKKLLNWRMAGPPPPHQVLYGWKDNFKAERDGKLAGTMLQIKN